MSAVHRLAAIRQRPTPLRGAQWSASLRAGDDFRLALTLYDDDEGSTANLVGQRSRLALLPDDPPRGWYNPGYCRDYGFGIGPGCTYTASGFTVEGRDGRLNFMIPPFATQALGGRYRMLLQVDCYDGVWTEVEGIINVKPEMTGLGHQFPEFFRLDASRLDGDAILAPGVMDGMPVDADGFPLLGALPIVFAPPPPGGNFLNVGILNRMTLSSDGVSAPSSILNIGTLNQMVLSS